MIVFLSPSCLLTVSQAFYLPNQDRPNLTVLTNAHVNRVVPSPDSGSQFVAESVEFKHEDQTYLVRAKKEIVLSTGSVRCISTSWLCC